VEQLHLILFSVNVHLYQLYWQESQHPKP